MERVTWGDRIRDVETQRVGSVWSVGPVELLVLWDEPLPQATTACGFLPRVRATVLPSYVRDVGGRLRRGYAYHRWRADHGAPMDHVAALIEEACVLIDEFYGH